jgi:hypothetical protein
MASILKVDTIQDQSGNNIINENADTITIGASGDTITVPTGASLTVPNGGLSGQNYPAFEAYLSADQSISDDVNTKVLANTEVFDTDSCYDNSTNYRFTPNVAGKYYVYGSIGFATTPAATTAADYLITIKRNDSSYRAFYEDPPNNVLNLKTMTIFAIVDMNGTTDYLELFGRFNVTSGGPIFRTGEQNTVFGAYRIGS